MSIQATRCTKREVRALNHWRRNGHMIRAGEKIPLNTFSPPSLATRRPLLDAFMGGVISVGVVVMGCTWLAYGAGLMS